MADGDSGEIEAKVEAIAVWLSESDLEDYLPQLLENGYNSLTKCLRIDANSLSRIGIDNSADGEKFTAAVEKLESRGIRRSPSPASVDPDQVYKDFLDQMEVEKQKQAANVLSEEGAGHGLVVRRRLGTLARAEAVKRISMNVMSKAMSVDLDALLNDLCLMEEAVKGLGGQEMNSTSEIIEDQEKEKEDHRAIVPDLDFTKFLEEMKAHAQPSVSDILSVEDFVSVNAEPSKEDLQQLSEDVEAIIREAAAENAEKNEEREREMSPKPKVEENKKKQEEVLPPLEEQEPAPLTPTQVEIRERLEKTKAEIEKDTGLTEDEREAKLKQTKILIAMEKLKEAQVQKLVVKVMCPDDGSKMLIVDEHKVARDVTAMMILKTHSDNDPCYCLLERLTDLHLERVIEDHERLVPILACWPRENNNSLLFVHRPGKYRLLTRPQDYMPSTHPYATGKDCRFDDNTRKDLILKELFVSQHLPELEGQLRLMVGSRHKWRKHYFVLRKSGLYYNMKGKSTSILDVVRLVDWRDVDIYSGKDYKKHYKAPSDYCLSLKPIGPIEGTKHRIHHVCAKSKLEMVMWLQGMRIAKFGVQLRTDYDQTVRLMPWLQLESNTAEDMDGKQTPTVSSTDSSDETEEEQSVIQGNKSVVKVAEDEVDDHNLTLLQRRFRDAWLDNADKSASVSEGFTFSFGAAPLSPPHTPQSNSGGGGITSVDEEGMFTVKLK